MGKPTASTEKLLCTAAAQVLADLNILGALREVIVQSGPNPQVLQMLGAAAGGLMLQILKF